MKATINSLKNNPLKKKSPRKVNMMRAKRPPAEDNNTKARPIQIHHTESSITSDTTPSSPPIQPRSHLSEGSTSKGKSEETDKLPIKKDINKMTFTGILADEIRSRGTFDRERRRDVDDQHKGDPIP